MQDHPETLSFIRKRLPHWEVNHGRYFVTLSRAGAIPADAVRRIRMQSEEIKRLQGGELLKHRRRIFREMEAWLDRSDATHELVQSGLAEMLIEAVEHRRQRKIWNVFQYVIMPSHIHLFFSLAENGTGLIHTMNEFKRWTGQQAARWAELKSGHFWEREWFDHWSRTPEEDEKIIKYLRNNPVKAGLVKDFREWRWSWWGMSLPASSDESDVGSGARRDAG